MRPTLASWLGLSILGMASAANPDVPATKDFIRRMSARAVMVGNYLYIDGGEVTQLVNDKPVDTYDMTMNSTLSIDMSKSWSSDSVEIRTISKAAPKLYNQAIWADRNEKSFYIWGGHSNHGRENDLLTTDQIWRFIVDGNGGGAWTKEVPDNIGAYKSFNLAESGAFTTAHNTGFWLGGFASGWTQKFRASSQTIPGMVSFNMTTRTFQNDSTPDVSPFGTITAGKIQYIPRFGPHGLIAVFGGSTSSLVPGSSTSYRDFRNLTFFDPVSRDWYWQTTTGTMPTPRENLCVFGAESTDGTYEIFVFGGQDAVAKKSAEDMYVLTLPGFEWTKLDAPQGGARTDHSCVVAGNRQMITVGGLNRLGTGESFRLADPFPQGLGVFDMTELTWSTDYNAEAAAYESPQMIKEWYDQNKDLASVEWSSDEVKQLFTSEKTNLDGGVTGEKSDNDNKGDESSTRKAKIGPIVGGVVGGVVVVAACVAAAMLIRRRRRQRREGQFAPPGAADPETPGTGTATLVATTPVPPEYYGPRAEMDSNGRVHEMADDKKAMEPVELDATGMDGSGGLATKERVRSYTHEAP
ncbi:hypothetical protein jhhlp_006326 [Lomentospora prolificans]|uniref:Kelch repeat protein n=1 Tax=Lomentospora prolificans TaxID=41688 RepID=A0A2N3N5L1_9PEZI|nr:hypothetical protein jhhlp_006326 [Lomentospora prolificans]